MWLATLVCSANFQAHRQTSVFIPVRFPDGKYLQAEEAAPAACKHFCRPLGNIYHRYLKIHYSVPKQVQLLTEIANRTIETHGVPFRDVMDGLVAFIRREATEPTIIITDGGHVHDFPILLASCMKHTYNDLAVLSELVYVDSMQNLMDAGYRRPGLDALCEELKIKRRGHSALDDAKILQTVCTMKSEEMLQNPYGYTFIDIISYLNAKYTHTSTEVVWSAPNMKQVCKTAPYTCKYYDIFRKICTSP